MPVSEKAWRNYSLLRWTVVFAAICFCWWGEFPYRRAEGLWLVAYGQLCVGFGAYLGFTLFNWLMSGVTVVSSNLVFGNDPHYRAWIKEHHPYYDTEYSSMGSDGSPTLEEVQEEKEKMEESDTNVYPMRNPRPSDN